MSGVFDPEMIVKQIVVVGLGGTGAQWARSIARMLYDRKRRGQTVPETLFVDPDIVEAKNVGRQLFTPGDIGSHKAEVLAKRFNYALGLSIAWRSEKLDAEWFKDERGFSGKRLGGDDLLICGAVDGHEGRREMARLQGVWIDAGNHFNAGQVCIGNSRDAAHIYRAGNRDTKRNVWRAIPNAALSFPALLEPDVETRTEVELSCAELTMIGEQHLLINDAIAVAAASYTYDLLYRRPIKSFITHIGMEPYSIRSIEINDAELTARLGSPEDIAAAPDDDDDEYDEDYLEVDDLEDDDEYDTEDEEGEYETE